MITDCPDLLFPLYFFLSRYSLVLPVSCFNIDEEVKLARKILETTGPVTIHYDTTTRDSIDGEWVAMLVKFGEDGSLYRLRSLSMAFEDRANITELFVQQFRRLALAGNSTVQALWEKITAIMTDSVAKNLKISEEIAAALESEHVPYQLLCCAHWCENVDKKCLEALYKIEEAVELKSQVLSKMKTLAAFIRGKKSIVEVAIEAITKLVTKTGLKISLQKEMQDICDDRNTQLKVGKYIQRRFGRLGYCAGSIVNNLPELRTLLNTHQSNQLSQACRVYLDIPFIIDALVSLSKITEAVTLPFLVMVQKETHTTLLSVFPQLCIDLSNGKFDTLVSYHTSFGFQFPPETPNQRLLQNQMAKEISDGLKLQRGREYAFFSNSTEQRATDVSSLPEHLLELLPTHNLDCERELAIFDKKVERMSGFNQKSTYKGLRDEMMLYRASLSTYERHQAETFKKLDEMEKEWNQHQEQKRLVKKQQKEAEAKKQEIRWQDLFKVCNTWGGPCNTATMLIQAEKRMKRQQKTDVDFKKLYKTEIVFNRLKSHHSDLDYGVNKKTNQQLRETLIKILSYEEDNAGNIDAEDAVFQYLTQLGQE